MTQWFALPPETREAGPTQIATFAEKAWRGRLLHQIRSDWRMERCDDQAIFADHSSTALAEFRLQLRYLAALDSV
ncbi:MAG: hypothetical protein B7Y89_13335 [Novosphingobium sp. 32-60-15]|nr:MAG: hypothetical protein B7Y89_13335 [Novosphingobium sp. 32-60-15]